VTPALARKRLWTVRDFAEFMGLSAKQARALLKKLNEEVGGMLLRSSGGRKPEYTLFPGSLKKAFPDLFVRLETLEARVDQIEERQEQTQQDLRRVAQQVGQLTRQVARLQSRRAA